MATTGISRILCLGDKPVFLITLADRLAAAGACKPLPKDAPGKGSGKQSVGVTTPARAKLRAHGVLLKENQPVTFEEKIQCHSYKGRHNCRLRGEELSELTTPDPVNSMSLSQPLGKGLTSLVISSTVFLSHSPILIGRVILCLCSKVWCWKRTLGEKEEVGEEQDCSEKCNFTKEFSMRSEIFLWFTDVS